MKLDHVVQFTKQTPEQIAEQTEGAVAGGRHEQWGTYNALKYLQNGYIEWLAVEDESLANSSAHPLVTQLRNDLSAYGEGWGTLCFSTEDIVSLDHRLQSQGFTTTGVLDASRKTGSGALKRWKMLFVKESDMNRLPAPFFIEWEDDEESRKAALQKDGVLSEAGASERITECRFVTECPEQTIERWRTLLDVTEETGDSILLDGVWLRFTRNPKKSNRMQAVVTGQAKP